MLEPRWAKSNAEMADPTRANDRRERELPSVKQSKTLTFSPTFLKYLTEQLLERLVEPPTENLA
jgi:hypothetical protein